MTRLASLCVVAVACAALAGCLVGDPDALRQDDGVGDGPGSGGPGPDAAPVGGGADAAPGTPDAAGEPSQQSVLEDFGRCMTLADWDAANLGAIALVQTQASGNCATCHSTGLAGNYQSLDSTANFNAAKTFPYVQRYAVADALLQLSVSDDLVVKGQQAGHPVYTLPPDLVAGLSQFFDATNARYIANGGNCPPQ